MRVLYCSRPIDDRLVFEREAPVTDNFVLLSPYSDTHVHRAHRYVYWRGSRPAPYTDPSFVPRTAERRSCSDHCSSQKRETRGPGQVRRIRATFEMSYIRTRCQSAKNDKLHYILLFFLIS